jgi:hypothetical protein
MQKLLTCRSRCCGVRLVSPDTKDSNDYTAKRKECGHYAGEQATLADVGDIEEADGCSEG